MMSESELTVANALTIECLDNLKIPLVNRFYKQCRYSAKAGRGESVFVARLQNPASTASQTVEASRHEEHAGKTVGKTAIENKIVAAVRLVPKKYTLPGEQSAISHRLEGDISLQVDECLFLRSFCVLPEQRGQGIGQFLLKGLVPALNSGFTYCFPFTWLERFYSRAGFQRVDPDSVATDITQAYQRYQTNGRDIILMTRQPQPVEQEGRAGQ